MERVILEFLCLGEGLIGTTDERSFRAHFGVAPFITAILWELIRHCEHVLFQPIHLLWALHFLKCYQSSETAAAFCRADRKTWRKWVWLILLALYLSLSMVIINCFGYITLDKWKS